MANYDSRLQRLESRLAPAAKPPHYTLVIDEYGDDRRLHALTVGDQRVKRLPGESKKDLYGRATAGVEHIMHLKVVDARDGRPYPWADDDEPN